MIKPIVKDLLFLQQKAQLATEEDIEIGQDLLDALKANQIGRASCRERV